MSNEIMFDCLIEKILKTYKKYNRTCCFLTTAKKTRSIIIAENLTQLYLDSSMYTQNKLTIDKIAFCNTILDEKQRVLKKFENHPIQLYQELYQIYYSFSEDINLFFHDQN
jgi:hypothetical protein